MPLKLVGFALKPSSNQNIYFCLGRVGKGYNLSGFNCHVIGNWLGSKENLPKKDTRIRIKNNTFLVVRGRVTTSGKVFMYHKELLTMCQRCPHSLFLLWAAPGQEVRGNVPSKVKDINTSLIE